MSMKVDVQERILILAFDKVYSIETIGEVMNLLESEENLENIEDVIIDCTRLRHLENFGGEFFLLMKNRPIRNFLFCGLNRSLKPIIDAFGRDWGFESVKNFATREDAINFIKNNP